MIFVIAQQIVVGIFDGFQPVKLVIFIGSGITLWVGHAADAYKGVIGKAGYLSPGQTAPQGCRLPGAQVTSFTYDPLVGISSMTDPKGYTTTYEYDQFNRLKSIKDADNNLLSDYEYHFKN